MDHIKFPYRSSGHLALMHVINDTGAWERNGLDVEFDKPIGKHEAHELVPKGEVEFVSGNHVSTYAARARGDTWTYLGQTVSKNSISLVTRKDTGINKLEDVRKRKFGSKDGHPGYNTWLYLKQAGIDPDKGEVEIVSVESAIDSTGKSLYGKRKRLPQMLQDGDIDACFLSEPELGKARALGLKVIDIPLQDMIFFMTISSSMKFVKENPEIVKRMLKSVLEGIAYFKINRDPTIKILMAKHKREGDLDLASAERLYDDLSARLEPKLYPSLGAIYNVYQEALKVDEKNGDAKKIHPLALWDVHLLREIDDSGFINNLYKDHPHLLDGYGG
jgi:ABC-type nitrate/sulfonate/bicarbonate transport system substrate-binding protein